MENFQFGSRSARPQSAPLRTKKWNVAKYSFAKSSRTRGATRGNGFAKNTGRRERASTKNRCVDFARGRTRSVARLAKKIKSRARRFVFERENFRRFRQSQQSICLFCFAKRIEKQHARRAVVDGVVRGGIQFAWRIAGSAMTMTKE